MIKVYVAGPYSQGDNFDNVRRAVEVGETLRRMGFAPFVPHLWAFAHYREPISWDDVMELCLVWVRASDAVLRIPGPSRGADVEVETAIRAGIPVFETIAALQDWAASEAPSEPRTWEAWFEACTRWQRETFPNPSSAGLSRHLEREAGELREALAAMAPNGVIGPELADVVILANGIADVRGIDLFAACARKLAINRNRRWKAPDAEGVIEHVRGEGEEAA